MYVCFISLRSWFMEIPSEKHVIASRIQVKVIIDSYEISLLWGIILHDSYRERNRKETD